MKKTFFAWLIGMVCVAGAAESPFKKGTTYLNFNFRINGNPYEEVIHPELLGIYPSEAPWDSFGNAKIFIDPRQRFETMATGINLEFGLTDYLGLEFQYYTRSSENFGVYIEAKVPPGVFDDLPSGTTAVIPLGEEYAPGTFLERVLSLGCNYHLNFIGIRRLDVYTGFQLGIEGKFYTVHLRSEKAIKYKNPFLEKELMLFSDGHGEDYLIIYSHIAAGLNYFITDKIAVNLCPGMKIGISGHESKFFWRGGLTIKLK